MDIRKRKTRTINLRKRKIEIKEVPVRIEIRPEIVENPIVETQMIGDYSCIQCKAPVTRELERCSICKTEHQVLVQRLDAIPRQKIEKIPEKWVYYKQILGGVVVTTRMTEEEARLMGKKIE